MEYRVIGFESVETDYGTFDNALKVQSYDIHRADNEYNLYWYVRGVGMVKSQDIHDGEAWFTYSLSGYRLAGEE